MSDSSEKGSAAVLGVVMVCLLTTLALVAVVASGILVGHRRAGAAADLAALAGAAAVQRGEDACAAAGHVAGANSARLVGCTTVGETVSIEVATEVPSAFGATWTVAARARAGPVP